MEIGFVVDGSRLVECDGRRGRDCFRVMSPRCCSTRTDPEVGRRAVVSSLAAVGLGAWLTVASCRVDAGWAKGWMTTVSPGEVVVDLARCLGRQEEETMSRQIRSIEEKTEFHVRLLTQQGPPRLEDFSARTYWESVLVGPEAPKTVLVVADTSASNILQFRVGDDVLKKIRRDFWLELQGRYGNIFYVKENGENGAIKAAMDAIDQCLNSEGLCLSAPGLGRDQWALSAVLSAAGGFIAGPSARTRDGRGISWKFLLLFSPLWAMFFIAFGIGPVVTKEGWMNQDFAINVLIFIMAAIASWSWVPFALGKRE